MRWSDGKFKLTLFPWLYIVLSDNSSPSVEFKSASGQGPPSNGSPTSSATRNRSASTGSSSSGLFSKLLHRDKKQSSSTSGEERAHVF